MRKKTIPRLKTVEVPSVVVPAETYVQWTRFAAKHGILVGLVNEMRDVVARNLWGRVPSKKEWKYIYETLESAVNKYEDVE